MVTAIAIICASFFGVFLAFILCPKSYARSESDSFICDSNSLTGRPDAPASTSDALKESGRIA